MVAELGQSQGTERPRQILVLADARSGGEGHLLSSGHGEKPAF